jgi:hypothetical protein
MPEPEGFKKLIGELEVRIERLEREIERRDAMLMSHEIKIAIIMETNSELKPKAD